MKIRMRICLVAVAAALLLPLLGITSSAEAIAAPSVSARSAILIDADRGTVIYQKDADLRRPMASTTKIMTALVALEQASLQTVVTVPAEAVGVEGSSIYLTEGETLTMEELLYALLLQSANDAAVAIAIAVGGSVEGFADLMNQKASALGLHSTQFENPHGLDSMGHYTTAAELARITYAAMQNEIFAKMVATRKISISHNGTSGVRLLVNHNKMLRLYEGAIGVKTGYTHKSGRCLVSAAERNGVRLIAVTLHAPNDWDDHAAMLDYGFSAYTSVALCREHEINLPLSVVGGEASAVTVSNSGALTICMPNDHPEILQRIELPRFLYAGVADGECVGKVRFFCDLNGDGRAEAIGETALTVQIGTAKKPSPKKSFWAWICSLFGK